MAVKQAGKSDIQIEIYRLNENTKTACSKLEFKRNVKLARYPITTIGK